MDKVLELQNMISESKDIVFFTGAGVSTDSGLKDFRSKDGLYNMHYDYPPEKILSHYFFMNNTEYFYKFYKENLNSLKYEPNLFHKYLKKLEKNKNVTIITQNIDGLHTKAGSNNVLELHGSIYHNYCMQCHKSYPPEKIFNDNFYCECGGIIKPDVILYDEALNEDVINNSLKAIIKADLLIVVGTSLLVYPAASLIDYCNGKIVIINNDKTPFDYKATLVINKPIIEIFRNLK